MDYEQFKKSFKQIWKDLKGKDKKHAYLYIFLLLCLFLFWFWSQGWFECVKAFFYPNEHQIVNVSMETYHIGTSDKPEYPVKKEAGMTEVKLFVILNKNPIQSEIYMEVFDVDSIGGKVFINGFFVGDLTVAEPWHKDDFKMGSGILKKGGNTIVIKSNLWPNGQIEDFLVRNIQVCIEY